MSDQKNIATEAQDEQATDRIDVLIENASVYLSDEDCEAIEEAYLFAKDAHEGQFRKSGEPFIMHPVEVAIILSDLRMDSDTLRAAVLHDTVEDTEYTLDDIRKKFGDTVAELVDGVTKINSLEIESLSHAQVNNLRKMLMAMSNDIRVIVIKPRRQAPQHAHAHGVARGSPPLQGTRDHGRYTRRSPIVSAWARSNGSSRTFRSSTSDLPNISGSEDGQRDA